MKKIVQKTIFALILFCGIFAANGQNSGYNWNFQTNCLKFYGTPSSGINGGCIKYRWQINGATYNSYNVTHTFTAAGTYTVCLKIVDSCKKFDTLICKNVTVKRCDSNLCSITPRIELKKDCRKFNIYVFPNNLSGAQYSWEFGDGNTSSTANPTYTYSKRGTYTVCVTVKWTGSNGTTCSKKVCTEVHAGCDDPCRISGNFTFSNLGNGTYKFSGSSNSGVTYLWNFGDGSSGTGKNITKRFTKSGVYNVCVTIIDKTGRCKVQICKRIEVKVPCNIQGGFTWKKDGNKFYFRANSTTGAIYEWTFGDGSTGRGMDPSKIYSKPGTYTVCVTIYTQDRKCSTKICKTVVVESKRCKWNPYVSLGSQCKYAYVYALVDSMNVIDTTCNYITVSWGDGTSSNGSKPNYYHNYSNPGTYTVCIKFQNFCTNCDTIICKELVIKECPPKYCGIKASLGVTVNCRKVTVEATNLNLNGSRCFKYKILWGDSTFSYDRVGTKTFAKDGSYTICMRIYDSCKGCDTVICKTVQVKACTSSCNWKSLGVGITYKLDCRKITYTVNTVRDSCVSFQVYLNNTLLNTNGYTVSANGTYSLCVKFTNSCKKCDTIICQNVKVDCNPCLNLNAEFKVDSISKSGKAYIRNQSTGATFYYWSFGDGTSSTDKTPNKTYSNTGQYKICLIVYDSTKKCIDSICTWVAYVKGRSMGTGAIQLPSQIKVMPNPAKDKFEIVSETKMKNVSILNSLGKVVFESGVGQNSYQINASAWSDGVYFIKVHTENGMVSSPIIISNK